MASPNSPGQQVSLALPSQLRGTQRLRLKGGMGFPLPTSSGCFVGRTGITYKGGVRRGPGKSHVIPPSVRPC